MWLPAPDYILKLVCCSCVHVWLPAPDYILKLVCCSCSSAQPCHSSRCGCVATSPRLHTETCNLHSHVIQVDVDVWLPAPDYILKLVCCSCSSAQPCHSSRCGCVATSPRLHTETCMLLVFICTCHSSRCGCVATSPRLHTETCMLLVFICTAMSFK